MERGRWCSGWRTSRRSCEWRMRPGRETRHHPSGSRAPNQLRPGQGPSAPNVAINRGRHRRDRVARPRASQRASSRVAFACARTRQVERAVEERDVRERLREVPEHAPGTGVVSRAPSLRAGLRLRSPLVQTLWSGSALSAAASRTLVSTPSTRQSRPNASARSSSASRARRPEVDEPSPMDESVRFPRRGFGGASSPSWVLLTGRARRGATACL